MLKYTTKKILCFCVFGLKNDSGPIHVTLIYSTLPSSSLFKWFLLSAEGNQVRLLEVV